MTLENILIIGATGHQGGAVITALRSHTPKQFNLFALTRNPSSPPALRLASQGVTIIQGDLSSPTAIFTQILSPYGVFLVTVPGPHEKDQALSFIDAAMNSGAQHIVFTSVDRGGPDKSEHDAPMLIPHFGVKRDIEKYLKSSVEKIGGKTTWVILRPTSFMDNLALGFVGRVVATMLGQMGRTKVSFVSVKDIGRVAAMAFEKVDKFGGRAITLTGDLLTFDEMNTIFKEETGEKMPLTYEVLVNGMQWAISDLGKTMKYFREGALGYEMDRDIAKDLGLRDFRAWLREDSKFVVLAK